ncbi:MAG: alkaline shock response membrane anchor protein AmaP [Clostridia bacterium]|nr:alkaline shock response membrane anchor protein AmaP [Clostridia bacterium]
MKILDRIGLALFSTIVLILSIILCLMIFGWLKVDFVHEIVTRMLENQICSNILLGLSCFFILLATKCIFFDSGSKQEADYKNGILLENEDGKLLITKDTLENLVSSIVKGFESAENVTTKVELDKENNVKVYVNLSVKENAIIKELSTNLQTKIKTTIKKTSDLDVKEVNIKVRDIEPTKKMVQEP